MTGTLITSREEIAQSADTAALWWISHPFDRKPVNDFCPIAEPDHHRAWRASFERSLLLHSTGEVSA